VRTIAHSTGVRGAVDVNSQPARAARVGGRAGARARGGRRTSHALEAVLQHARDRLLLLPRVEVAHVRDRRRVHAHDVAVHAAPRAAALGVEEVLLDPPLAVDRLADVEAPVAELEHVHARPAHVRCVARYAALRLSVVCRDHGRARPCARAGVI
jgi:hypothetical protein